MGEQIQIITSVAPRDLHLLHDCAKSVAAAVYSLEDSLSLSKVLNTVSWHIVIDGEVSEQDYQRLLAMIRGERVPSLIVGVAQLKDRYGPGCARNYALAAMHEGDITFFIDADDLLLPWGLIERLRTFLVASEMNPTRLPFLYGQVIWSFFDPQKQTHLKQIRMVPGSSRVKDYLQENNVLIPDMVCCSAGLLQEAGGFEPHLVCGEDGNLWRRILENELALPVALQLPVAVYNYREDSQSKLATSKPAVAEFNKKAFHLGVDWNQHGPMGQNLDDEASRRGKEFMESGEYPHKDYKILAPGVEVEKWDTVS